jgi:hypothetical protein
MEGGTTFHFIDASPAEALERAREAAGGEATSSPSGVMHVTFTRAGV